jgi:hypothetical protein
MKTRLVKKFSAIAKHSPGRFKKLHMQYLMKSWRKSYNRLNDVERYAVCMAMLGAFKAINFANHVGYIKHKPTPRYEPGTYLIKDWAESDAPIREGEPVLIRGKWYMPADMKMPKPCNTPPPIFLTDCQA